MDDEDPEGSGRDRGTSAGARSVVWSESSLPPVCYVFCDLQTHQRWCSTK